MCVKEYHEDGKVAGNLECFSYLTEFICSKSMTQDEQLQDIKTKIHTLKMPQTVSIFQRMQPFFSDSLAPLIRMWALTH